MKRSGNQTSVTTIEQEEEVLFFIVMIGLFHVHILIITPSLQFSNLTESV